LGGWWDTNVRPARNPSSTPRALRSSASTHVVGWPGPWACEVITQWLSLAPVMVTCSPRSSQPYQYLSATSLSAADGKGGL
jgi:hypothetical protein